MYDAPDQFEPLLPASAKQEPLLAQAHDLARAATELAGPPVAGELRELLRGMNFYDTNCIEGNTSGPAGNRAGAGQYFSANKELADATTFGYRHIDAERLSNNATAGNRCPATDAAAAVRDIHRERSRLLLEDLGRARASRRPRRIAPARGCRWGVTSPPRTGVACPACSAGGNSTAASAGVKRRLRLGRCSSSWGWFIDSSMATAA